MSVRFRFEDYMIGFCPYCDSTVAIRNPYEVTDCSSCGNTFISLTTVNPPITEKEMSFTMMTSRR